MSRSCSGCTVCCTTQYVPELKKPVNVICQHCELGCKIYSTRPKSCQDFECAWLQGDMPEWMKPDKIHMMVERLPKVNVVLAVSEPGYEKIWRTNEITKILQQEYQQKGIAVISSPDKFALLPEGRSYDDVWNDIKIAAKILEVI